MPDTRPLEVTVGHPAREEESLSLSISFHLLGKFVLTRTNGDRMKSSPWSEAERERGQREQLRRRRESSGVSAGLFIMGDGV
jgi:hypothetical protein